MNLRAYAVVTAAYWALTVTDGALRMLVLLHFHDLGYDALTLAFLFLLYEVMGVATNLVGGWMGARHGLNRTLYAGLAAQIVALGLLSLVGDGWERWASVAFVMGCQALAGVAKDLTKMSAKSAVKVVVGDAGADDHQSRLFTWVAALTGSKNALKGVGFFVGGALLGWLGFATALRAMAVALVVVLGAVLVLLRVDIGRATTKPVFGDLVSKSRAINTLSFARLFLFGARDIWFVVALPVFLSEELDWSFSGIGAFMAAWVIGYGVVQAFAPRVLGSQPGPSRWHRDAVRWAGALALVTAAIASAVSLDVVRTPAVVGGLLLFGVVFAVNSSLHSFLILAYTTAEDVALDVGFYYSANAAGRLLGTLLSGLTYLAGGLAAALWVAGVFVVVSGVAAARLEPVPSAVAAPGSMSD